MSCISKNFVGFCPTQQKDCSITVKYYGDSALEGKETFSRGRFDCWHKQKYGCHLANVCPIMAQAPYKL